MNGKNIRSYHLFANEARGKLEGSTLFVGTVLVLVLRAATFDANIGLEIPTILQAMARLATSQAKVFTLHRRTLAQAPRFIRLRFTHHE